MSLPPNASIPCPSSSHRRTMWAHGRQCPVCEPDAEWTYACPACFRPVPIVGLTVQPHQTGGPGTPLKRQECRGAGQEVEPPTFVERPASELPRPVRSLAAVRVLERGGVA